MEQSTEADLATIQSDDNLRCWIQEQTRRGISLGTGAPAPAQAVMWMFRANHLSRSKSILGSRFIQEEYSRLKVKQRICLENKSGRCCFTQQMAERT